MPSLIDIRRRIRSVKSTQQITRAMKLVSAAKLRRAQDRVLAARPYAGVLAGLLADVARSAKTDERLAHRLLAERPEERIQLILITADRGLAGAFNSNLIKTAQRFLEEHQGRSIEFETIGRKGRDFFRKRGGRISGEHVGMTEKVTYAYAAGIAAKVIERFAGGEIDAVYLLYNEFKSVMQQKVTLEKGKRYAVRLGGWEGSVAEVRKDSQAVGIVGWPPYEADLAPPEVSGEALVEVVVYGSLKNLLGPHHNVRQRGLVTPWSFKFAPEAQPPLEQYDTLGYGLTEPFTIIERQ